LEQLLGALSSLLRDIGVKLGGKRSWTPSEVRDLLAAGQLDDAARAVDALSPDTPSRELVQHCLRGEVAFRRHDDAAAERAFRQALSLAPGSADAHYGLSLLQFERGDTESALRHAQFASNNGGAGRFSAQLGLCHLSLANYSRAKEALLRATRLDPSDKASWNNLGIARRAHGDFRGARLAFDRALALDAGFERAQQNRTQLEAELERLPSVASAESKSEAARHPLCAEVQVLADAGDISGAIDRCERLCTEYPEELDLVVQLSSLYGELGDAQTGIDALEAFLACHLDRIDAAAALGKALVAHGEVVTAKPHVQRALDARPDDVSLLLAMSEIRFHQERYADAGELLERAFALEPSVHIKGRLASNLIARCKYEDGLALIDEMLVECPDVAADVLPLQTMALNYLGRHDEILAKLDEQIARQPYDPQSRFSRATINLLAENFGQGWDDYAFRNLEGTRHLRMMPFPQWDGGSLEGKTILVAAEQGLGDQIMFASCLPDLAAKGPQRVIVEVVDRVAPTLARSFPQFEWVPTKQDKQLAWVRDLGHVDCFILMGDLPRFFRRQRENFPRHDGYLRADAQRVAYWRQALDARDDARPLKIGLSWRGGTEATRTSVRSLAVTELAPLFAAADAQWVCLQYGDVSADLAAASEAGLELAYWPGSIKDLDEFAAMIKALDLIVTVCNTTVHYTGALGKPVWVMAPRVPEWRYGLNNASMPWYPSSRVWRQTRAGDWGEVIRSVAEQIRLLA
jgi:tetratricopeptide (TPR) repeat protein